MKTYEATEYAYKNGYKKGYEDGFKEGYDGGVDVGKRHAMEWIPASDPPKDDLPVLVTCGRGYRPFVARYDRIWKRWKVSHTLKITHWQPLPSTSNLPEPPKGE